MNKQIVKDFSLLLIYIGLFTINAMIINNYIKNPTIIMKIFYPALVAIGLYVYLCNVS